MTLFNGNAINWEAYQLGFSSCENNVPGNPFDKETDQWYSWNRGWNAY